MHNKSIKELINCLKKGKYSPSDITKYFLSRIKKFNIKINAMISICDDLANKKSLQIDKFKYNKNMSLCGIPFIHKDIFCTKDLKTSAGSKMLDNFVPIYDSTVNKKMDQAGMILLGKSNMDEFAMGGLNETSYYGPVSNPWNINLSPGGSSGGSAACVSSRIIPIATGSDTGGSVRQPASFCGVTGFKPTYGRISRFGMIAFASSLDHVGIISKTAEDCAFLSKIISGNDYHDMTSSKHKVVNYNSFLNKPLLGLKIGVPKEFIDRYLCFKSIQILKKVSIVLNTLGASIKIISLPNVYLSIPAYYIIMAAEASSNLSRYDGIRFGYNFYQHNNLREMYKYNRQHGFGPEVKKRCIVGAHILSNKHSNNFYKKADYIKQTIINDYNRVFKCVDLILSPVNLKTAHKIGKNSHSCIDMYISDIYTSSVNLSGLPAVSFPSGVMNNMPVGTQLIGNYFEEHKILNAVHQYQLQTCWHKNTPPGFGI